MSEPVLLGFPGIADPALASTADANRRLPRLRRTFRPLEPEREAMLRQRNRNAFAEDPRLVELERRLLNLGGLMALLFLHEPQIAELLERGRYFPGAKAQIRRGQRSASHSNVSLQFVLTDGAAGIATGCGLSPDGLWRQHSWGVAVEDGRIIETTRRRLRYYGFVLDDAEILPFVLGTSGSATWSRKRKNA
jgi:hypothetical protein